VTTAPRIALRALREDDEAELLRIHRTPEVACWWGLPEPGFPWSDDPDSERFAIESGGAESGGALVGMIQVYEEQTPRYRHAAIDLFLDPAVRGRGIGGEAVALLARMLFEERGHHRVTIDPALDNVAAVRAYEKVGFRRVGVMRRYEREPDGAEWRDGLLMELLADEPAGGSEAGDGAGGAATDVSGAPPP
jgi:aminoglycoside 6'-N-acetyltransferase